MIDGEWKRPERNRQSPLEIAHHSIESLGGRAGHEIPAKRPRFRGASMKQDLRQYARMLVEVGLTLGVCDWGYCVYRQEYSARRGSATALDLARGERELADLRRRLDSKPTDCAATMRDAVGRRLLTRVLILGF